MRKILLYDKGDNFKFWRKIGMYNEEVEKLKNY